MPVYEFRCNGCEGKFELLVGMTAAAVALECPECGSQNVEKLMSAFRVGPGTVISATGTKTTVTSGGRCSSCGGGNCSSCSG